MTNAQTELNKWCEDNWGVDFAFKTRLDALKKACIVMNSIADGFKDEDTRNETKSLAWAISWAVVELAKYKSGEV